MIVLESALTTFSLKPEPRSVTERSQAYLTYVWRAMMTELVTITWPTQRSEETWGLYLEKKFQEIWFFGVLWFYRFQVNWGHKICKSGKNSTSCMQVTAWRRKQDGNLSHSCVITWKESSKCRRMHGYTFYKGTLYAALNEFQDPGLFQRQPDLNRKICPFYPFNKILQLHHSSITRSQFYSFLKNNSHRHSFICC